MAIRGVIFDLDGTLVDSGLDFDLMRREMGLADGQPLLESIERMSPADAQRCNAILAQHELAGAVQATLIPGVREFLAELQRRGIARAVATRNSRACASATLARLNLSFDPVVCREDGPIKPHPAAIWKACEYWGYCSSQCVMIGDYKFDIEAGRRAGAHTVLYRGPESRFERWGADFVLDSFQEAEAFWTWLDQLT